MTKKILSVLLAVLMVCCVIPFAAFADGDATVVSSSERVNAWNGKMNLVVNRLLDNEKSANWKYVAENNKELTDTMLTYTVFSLYDNAWQNAFDQSVSVDTAEKVLISLIEKVDTGIGDSKFEQIYKVLQTASDANDLAQKVNGFVKISDTLSSEEWTKAFKYIDNAIKIYKLYDKSRDDVIEMYARVLSVQAANDLYIEFLQYVADNCEYNVVATAAADLISKINASIEDLVQDELAKLALSTGTSVIQNAISLAMDTNAYTAVALKVYQVGTSVADVLWNTSDQYALMDELFTTFYAESCAVDWTRRTTTPEAYEFAVCTVLGLRQVGADTLYNLKLAQLGGFIGKVKNQLSFNIRFEYVSEIAFLQLAKYVLFDTPVSDYGFVSSIITAYTPALITAGSTEITNTNSTFATADGFFTSAYSEYTSNYIKMGFLTSTQDVKASADSDTLATLIVEKAGAMGVEDYSYTNVTVGPDRYAIVDTALNSKVYTYVTPSGADNIVLSADFVYPDYAAKPTAQNITNAVINVAKDEVSGKVISIKELIDGFFAKIKESLSSIFSFFKK
ncbi:MAG: hypothetical protein K6F64_08140 [Clostridia bacterium]|nr:hypothetical protein [Clostridia bacterium]